jgi:hypothetical protein
MTGKTNLAASVAARRSRLDFELEMLGKLPTLC